MAEKQLICIGCPMGCQVTVNMEGEEILSVTGNTCKRGDIYARKEVTNPTRIVTSSVCVKHGAVAMVSCKTENDIPKKKIFDVCKAIENVTVEAPVHIGDVLLENVCDTGVNIIATKDVVRI